MILALDVQYSTRHAVTAAVGFATWQDAAPSLELVQRSEGAPAPYQPGAFYRRELPFLLAAIAPVASRHPVEAVIVDGHVWLGAGAPGLGARLFVALGGRAAVVGVAKSVFRGGSAVAVLRGESAKPLLVSAAGMETARAAELVRSMHGRHRLPTLLRRADALARGRVTLDPVKAFVPA